MFASLSVFDIVIIALFWAAEICVFPLFIKAQWPKPCVKSFVLKMASASVFLAYGVYLACKVEWGTFALYMVLGLIGGWLGDLLLHLKPFLPEDSKLGEALSFVSGLLAFLAGHIMYVIAYIYAILNFGFKISWQTYVIIAAVIVIAVIVKFAAKIKLGIAAVPVVFYCATIATMLSMAITLSSIVIEHSVFCAVVLVVGAVLFVISDGTLVFCMFGNESQKKNFPLKAVNLTTYFIAQMLLASTILLVNNIAV